MIASWADTDKAIAAAIKVASGNLATIWSFQDAPQPGLDYVELALGAAATVWVDWINEDYDDTRPAHEQIVLTLGGLREVPLRIQVFSAAKVDEVGKATALATLDQVIGKLRLPTARDALAAVSVTPFDPGPVNWIPKVVATGFRGFAHCDVRCRMPAQALKEYADWIAKVTGTTHISGAPGGTISPPFSAP